MAYNGSGVQDMSNNKFKILTVDTDIKAQRRLSELLTDEGYKVISAASDAETVLLLKSHMPDIVISELLPPGTDGLRFIGRITEITDAPIIILSSETDGNIKAAALDAGASDYVTKPYCEAELSARIRMCLRNSRAFRNSDGSSFKSRTLTVDYRARRVFSGEGEVRLTQNEYNILALLTAESGKMLTYREIIKAVWGDYPDSGSIKKLQVNIANIRKKLGSADIIKNQAGVGYRADDGSAKQD